MKKVKLRYVGSHTNSWAKPVTNSIASSNSAIGCIQAGLRRELSPEQMRATVKNGSHGRLKRSSLFYRKVTETVTRTQAHRSDHEQLEMKGIWNEVSNLPW